MIASHDYGIIMDAVTDAYVGGKKISLFVNNIDKSGNTERFAFGYPLYLQAKIPKILELERLRH
ncbi:Uncharacterised protein [uncultured archaeon]|nr:Uncharacterised protein [uncultured archaeon]